MNKEITIVDSKTIIFYKSFWKTDQIELALAFDFVVDTDKGTVSGVILATTRKAMFEFIKYCYPSILTLPSYNVFKNYIFNQLKKIYADDYKKFTKEILPSLGYKTELRSYQKESLYNSLNKKKNFLALDMRLGKTIISASISKIAQAKTTIIVCPSVGKFNWFKELTGEKWGFNPLYFTILDSTKKHTIKAFQERFVIINYEMLSKYMSYLCKVKCEHIILDESHRIKNCNTLVYNNIHKIIEQFPDARQTYLSGTPIRNRSNDVFSYLKLSKNYLGKNHAAFLREYSYVSGTRVSGSKNLDKLHLMLSNFMFRKTQAECFDLPPKNITKYYLEADDYKTEYDKIINEIIENSDNTGKGLNSSLHSLNRLVATSKIPKIIELVDSIVEEGRKVIVFCTYTDPINILFNHYKKKCVKVDGSIDSFGKNEMASRFREDPSCMILIGQTQAAGEAINLSISSDIIHINIPFTPTELDQCNSRAIEDGKKSSININYAMCEDTIDETLFRLVANKSNDINKVIDKGKPGVTVYEDIPGALFKELLAKRGKTLQTA